MRSSGTRCRPVQTASSLPNVRGYPANRGNPAGTCALWLDAERQPGNAMHPRLRATCRPTNNVRPCGTSSSAVRQGGP